jgi:hypothetical protein
MSLKNLEKAPVKRDQYGFWWHPEIDWDKYTEEEDGDIIQDLSEAGFDLEFVPMVTQAPEVMDAMLNAWLENEKGSCLTWNPKPTIQNYCFLLAIYDTESGPYALYAFPKTNDLPSNTAAIPAEPAAC